jgi:cation:H+ antiporter
MAKRGNHLQEEQKEEEQATTKIDTYKSILYIVLGILALKYGGDFVVENASAIATAIGISEKLISLTIVAISTSLPELITSLTATAKGETDMAIGNIVGSQIFNILLIIGLSSVLKPINYSLAYNEDLVLLLAGNIVFALFPFIGEKNKMTRENGILFVIVYVVYMINIVFGN